MCPFSSAAGYMCLVSTAVMCKRAEKQRRESWRRRTRKTMGFAILIGGWGDEERGEEAEEAEEAYVGVLGVVSAVVGRRSNKGLWRSLKEPATSSRANVGRLLTMEDGDDEDEDGARALGRGEEEGMEGEKEESRLESNEGFSAITISSSLSLVSKWKSSSLLLEASTWKEEGGEEEVRCLEREERAEDIFLEVEGFSVSSIFPLPSILEEYKRGEGREEGPNGVFDLGQCLASVWLLGNL